MTKSRSNATAPAAKGELVIGTGTDASGILSVGANDTVLTADSSTATGLKWAAPAAGGGGLTLISTTTIGSAVASVTVTGAFSATYDNYLIIVSDGTGSASTNCNLTLGATTTGYYYSGYYVSWSSSTVNGIASSNGASWSATYVSSTAHSGRINLQNPFLSKNTTFQSILVQTDTGRYAANYAGFLNDTTSYTAFTITPSGGTLTGGKIRVYGYQNS